MKKRLMLYFMVVFGLTNLKAMNISPDEVLDLSNQVEKFTDKFILQSYEDQSKNPLEKIWFILKPSLFIEQYPNALNKESIINLPLGQISNMFSNFTPNEPGNLPVKVKLKHIILVSILNKLLKSYINEDFNKIPELVNQLNVLIQYDLLNTKEICKSFKINTKQIKDILFVFLGIGDLISELIASINKGEKSIEEIKNFFLENNIFVTLLDNNIFEQDQDSILKAFSNTILMFEGLSPYIWKLIISSEITLNDIENDFSRVEILENSMGIQLTKNRAILALLQHALNIEKDILSQNISLEELEEKNAEVLGIAIKRVILSNKSDINKVQKLLNNSAIYNKLIKYFKENSPDFINLLDVIKEGSLMISEKELAKSILLGQLKDPSLKDTKCWKSFRLAKAWNVKSLLNYFKNSAYIYLAMDKKYPVLPNELLNHISGFDKDSCLPNVKQIGEKDKFESYTWSFVFKVLEKIGLKPEVNK